MQNDTNVTCLLLTSISNLGKCKANTAKLLAHPTVFPDWEILI